MSIIQVTSDIDNQFLSRRELTCDFAGLGGKLLKSQAIDMVTAECSLKDKFVIPISLRNQVGRTTVTGTFYVYDDESLAKKHINPAVFTRMDKQKGDDA
ncbi:MAG: hypothetical protein F4Y82_04125 [Cenarchaeum sp. SB0665_bin_23]|nr:hypothetical protein [Cenarchaeum sp. SB0667_bin_13]MXY61285.1 hypothetical protein [Cenarchaeum sp. SB0665_bin_23]MXZ93116.1 hypothetical protein [Cenarchaeum sp. SB0666_bin_15]MYB47500.1 hypothetical protein [Cenarchaeum sp. SB0662_bin_33]MYC79065.1 hypothetical protein [Cenarchaeum sp. SB0661_bin_35]MYD58594.1 hypothetical protein [Cenarchaeum sp. SB0678_bin_8]MYG32761.1 hypothetical protein [Cenarchaeum sp. SB0677_bin_16]MYI51623.1 hypothetical protein [Cenarchaeum sp. SB0673_bin_9]M